MIVSQFLLFLPILLPSLTVTARRFHDFGHSGWIQIGFYFLIGILEIMNYSEELGIIFYLCLFPFMSVPLKNLSVDKYGSTHII